MIDQNRLKEVFSYNEHTGKFIRLIALSNRVKVGDIAGYGHSTGYKQISIDGNQYFSHRLAWLYVHGKWPEHEIDHINGIRDDNRIENLRCVDRQENSRNTAVNKNNTSGVSGVSWCKHHKKWFSRIFISHTAQSLGYFTNFFDAVCARKSAENKHGFHPNHGRENFGYMN